MADIGSFRFKALCFAAVLAGSAAVRTKDIAKGRQHLARALASESEAGPESDFQQQGCSWSSWKQSCHGEGCQYRYMLLDTRSQWCRLSDEHMLQKGGYMEYQNTLMNAKANKFAEQCQSLGWYNFVGNAKCKRRMIQMMRATTFLAKAEAHDEMKQMTDSQKGAQVQLLRSSIKTLLQAAGDDGQLILDALDRLEMDANSTESDPAEALMSLMHSTVYLLAGSEAEKEAARESILHNSKMALSATEVQIVNSSKTAALSVEETDALFDKSLEDFEAKLKNVGSSDALLQVQGSSMLADPSHDLNQNAPLLAVMVVMMIAVLWFAMAYLVAFTVIIGFFLGLLKLIADMVLFILALPFLILFR